MGKLWANGHFEQAQNPLSPCAATVCSVQRLHRGELFRHSTYRYISYQILTIHGGFPNFLSILLFSVTQCIRWFVVKSVVKLSWSWFCLPGWQTIPSSSLWWPRYTRPSSFQYSDGPWFPGWFWYSARFHKALCKKCAAGCGRRNAVAGLPQFLLPQCYDPGWYAR